MTFSKRVLISLFSLLSIFSFAQDRTASDYISDGELYLARGNCSFAQSVFQEALKQEPENIAALLGKGKALTCLGAWDAGIQEFQKVLGLDQNNVAAHVQLALAYQEQYVSDPNSYPGRLQDALAILQNAEALDPNNPEVLNSKGVVLFRQNDLAGARDALERAVALANNSELTDRAKSVMHINLGKTYRDLNEMDLALQSFRRAVMLNPSSGSAHNNVGNAYYKLGDCNNAVYELTQAVNLNTGSLDALSNLGIAMFECGEVANSVSYFEQALNIPGSLNLPPLYTYLARAYIQQGRFDEAVQRAQQGALLPPVTAEAFYYLGQAYESRNGSGDLQRAKEAYQSALELDANYQAA
ncbi:MAG: tetratricopeptide repeat protein, partial [Trueperaceae bacterium]|nr:tetratricopeptide repeat protein [Trueperaceae bacterium]